MASVDENRQMCLCGHLGIFHINKQFSRGKGYCLQDMAQSGPTYLSKQEIELSNCKCQQFTAERKEVGKTQMEPRNMQ